MMPPRTMKAAHACACTLPPLTKKTDQRSSRFKKKSRENKEGLGGEGGGRGGRRRRGGEWEGKIREEERNDVDGEKVVVLAKNVLDGVHLPKVYHVSAKINPLPFSAKTVLCAHDSALGRHRGRGGEGAIAKLTALTGSKFSGQVKYFGAAK
eukprot:593144-Rhodomonas_salina.1